MNSVELMNLTKESSAKNCLKSNAPAHSFAFGGIMEKALGQREKELLIKNKVTKKSELSSKNLLSKQLVRNKASDETEKSEDSFLQSSEIKEDIDQKQEDSIDSIVAIVYELLNRNSLNTVAAKDTLSSAVDSIEGNDSIKQAIVEEISALLNNTEFSNKEQIDKIADILTSLKQESIKTEDLISGADATENDLEILDESMAKKEEQEVNLTDSLIQKSKAGLMEKTSTSKTMDKANEIITDDIDAISEERENNAQSSPNDQIDKHIENNKSINHQMKKWVFEETHNVSNKANEAASGEYFVHNETNIILNDDVKLEPANYKHLNKAQIISKNKLFNQIIENSKLINGQDSSEIRIQLKPDSLGKLSISLIMEKGEMTAKFIAENNSVKEVIESNFSELKDLLNQKGINIQSLSVSVGQHGKGQYENQNFRAWKSSIKKSNYIESIDIELEESIPSHENLYNLNYGTVDIKV